MTEKERVRKPKSQVECCGYPLSIFFIVVNEFCERFSYYGMRAVLVLYFRYFLKWDDDTATSIYHTFVALCYLTPILGAIIADSWLGKFKTIIYLSIVYTIGQGVMAVSAVHDITDSDSDGSPNNLTLHIALSMVGLLLIALGTGGIKPCVAAFGGDQFEDHQEKQRSTFFSIFYLSINAGSLLSTVITPILRAQECGIHSQQKCYALAFGVPAALMVVALIVFIVGSGMYTKTAPEGNIMLKVCRCIGFALKNRWRHRSSQYSKRNHWMDWAEDKYDKRLIAQIKMVLKVLFLYIPLPMFWALFDQQGSRWTLQATTMDGTFGGINIQPDQMQTVNPILILVMVPVVDGIVYPLVKKCHLNFTPLRRMTVGMLLAASAFVVAAVVQIQIDKTLPNFPPSDKTQMKIINLDNSPVNVTVLSEALNWEALGFQATDYKEFTTDKVKEVAVCYGNYQKTVPLSFKSGARQTFLVTNTTAIYQEDSLIEDINTKPEEGNNAIRFVNAMQQDVNISAGNAHFGVIIPFTQSNYSLLPQGNTTFTIKGQDIKCVTSRIFGFGSSYTIVIKQMCNTDGGKIPESDLVYIEDIKPNTVHMAWQIPQYFLMTSGEVVFSVTGLEFSYSQAPSNMKSVLQAGWLFTVAVGNIIVLIVAEAGQLPDQWAEYILFAALLVAVSIAFAIMAYFYTYVDPSEIEAEFDKEEEKRDEFQMNKTPIAEITSDDCKQSKM
ncbi:S15A1 protein, partial [Atractosteus spatula]|nr:S15A1 protein [Atractosteus spatula]